MHGIHGLNERTCSETSEVRERGIALRPHSKERLSGSFEAVSSLSACESPDRRGAPHARNVEVGGRGGRVEAALDGPRPRGPGRVAVRFNRLDVERALGPSGGHCKVSLSSHTLRTLQSAKSIHYNAVFRGLSFSTPVWRGHELGTKWRANLLFPKTRSETRVGEIDTTTPTVGGYGDLSLFREVSRRGQL